MVKLSSKRRINSFLIFLLLQTSLLVQVFSLYGQSLVIPLTANSAEAQSALIAGRDLAENQHNDRAQAYFSKAITKDPACAIAYLLRAQVAPQPGKAYVENLKKAEALMAKASAGEQLLIGAELAQAAGQVAKSTHLLQKLVQEYPTDKRAHLALATHFLRQADYPAAKAALNAGLALAPDFPPFSLWLGQIAATAGQFPEATQALQNYQKLSPDAPNGLLATGNLYLQQGLYPEAIKSFATALQLDPQFYPAYVALSKGYLFNNRPVEARQQAEKLLEIAPTDNWRRQALFALSATYVDEGKYDKALAEAVKSKELAGKSGDTWAVIAELNNSGDMYLAQQKTVEAKAHYQQALLLVEKAEGFTGMKNSTRSRFLAKEAEMALVNKDLVLARQKTNNYQKQAVAQKDPLTMLDAHRLVGMVALQEKRYDVALKEFSQANPHDSRTWYLIGTAYLAMGDKAQARMHWATATQFNKMQIDYLLIRRKISL